MDRSNVSVRVLGRIARSGVSASFLCLALVAPVRAQTTCPTMLVSGGAGGALPNGHSAHPYLSSNGRWLVYITGATNIAPLDANGSLRDVILLDRWLGTVEIAMLSGLGNQPNDDCYEPRISDDGRWLSAFTGATNLAPGDTGISWDLYVRDRQTGSVERATVAASGAEIGSVQFATMSSNGRVVAFGSDDPNVVAGDTNGVADMFVRDLVAGTTVRINVGPGGVEANAQVDFAPALSADGRWIVYGSAATNLVAGDTNGFADVFLYDRVSGTNQIVSLTPAGAPGGGSSENCALTRDGRYVAFVGWDNLVAGDVNGQEDVVVRDLVLQTNEVASLGNGGVAGNGHSGSPWISGDGRFVGFLSGATNLTNNVPSVGSARLFSRDRALAVTTLVDLSSSGALGDQTCDQLTYSQDGSLFAFASGASNLAPGGSPGLGAVYLRDCSGAAPLAYCTPKVNSLGCTPVLWSSGTASASAGSGFTVTTANVCNQKTGILIYSAAGPAATPFAGGLLCLKAKVRRTTPQSSGGSALPASDCTGVYSFDFNAFVAASSDPALSAGEYVWCQQWSRDPGFPAPNAIGLSSALWFWLAP